MNQKEEWDKGAQWWHDTTGIDGRPHQKKDIDPIIFEFLENIENKKILDAGCGNGYFARKLARKKAGVVAFDFSSKLIAIANQLELKQKLGITYLVKDGANLQGIKNSSFDKVVANMCLMDIANYSDAISEFARVLKPKGAFVFSITHPAFWDYKQGWTIYMDNKKKYFARAVPQYLSSGKETRMFNKDFSVTQYHRPISEYAHQLSKAGFFIENMKEIAPQEQPTKASIQDGDITYRRSKYSTNEDKLLKKFATKEIPFFLIVKAIKK